MKIAKIKIENYKCLQGEHSFDPAGASFYLMGGNGKGKSSVGAALISILTKDLPKNPITTGEKAGYVEIHLTDGKKIYYKFSNEDGKESVSIELITADGITIKKPAEIFADLAGPGMSFNIDTFLSLAPKPRREMLEKLVKVDFTDLRTREAEAEQNRKVLKAKLRDQQAKVSPFDDALLTAEKINVAETSKQLNELMHKQTQVADLQNKVDLKLSQIRSLEKQLEALKVDLSELGEQQKALGEVDMLEVAQLNDKLQKAEEHNKAIDEAIQLKAEYDAAKDLERKVASAEQSVASIRENKMKLITENPLPADGLTFSEDGETLLLNGLPFEDNQIAQSAKMIAALQIAHSMLGQIKFLHFDASILDKENALKVLEWAEQHDMQLALERALWDGGELKFEIAVND